MGQNKLLPFNPNNQNILTDAAYQASSERLNGNTKGSTANSELVNKALKQAGAVANAIGQIVTINNGPDADDSKPSDIALGMFQNLKSTYHASFSVADDGTWNLTIADALSSSQTLPTMMYGIFASITASPADNQKVSINGGTAIPIKVNSTDNLKAGDFTANVANPLPMLFLVNNSIAYLQIWVKHIDQVFPTYGTVTITGDSFTTVVEGQTYSKVLNIGGVSADSLVNVQIPYQTVQLFIDNSVYGMYASNTNGVVTLFIQADEAPNFDFNIQYTIEKFIT